MSLLESSEKELTILKDKKKELNQKIKSQTEAINLSQKSIEKLTNIVGNYEQQKELVASQIKEQKKLVKQSKKDSLEFQKENLKGCDSIEFKALNLDNELALIDEKNVSKENKRIGWAVAFFIGFAILSIPFTLFTLGGPTFVCDNQIEEVNRWDVLNDNKDCSDGSDESTSSMWTSGDDTRAEIFDDDMIWYDIRDMGLCCIFGIVGSLIPIYIFRPSDNPRVELKNEFYREYGSIIDRARYRENVHSNEVRKLNLLHEKQKSLDKSNLDLFNKKQELEKSLDKKLKLEDQISRNSNDITNLNTEIKNKWKSIQDLIPHGEKLL